MGNEEEGRGMARRILKGSSGNLMEWKDPEGMAWIFREHQKEGKEQSGNRDREEKKKELSGRKDPQKGINRVCTYLRKKRTPSGSCP